MYYDMWTNIPKEAFEYDDYTYEEHFGKLIPSYVTVPVIRDYLEGKTIILCASNTLFMTSENEMDICDYGGKSH